MLILVSFSICALAAGEEKEASPEKSDSKEKAVTGTEYVTNTHESHR